MAEAPVVHIGENSAEHVAYRLMRDVLIIENKDFSHLNRKQFLDLYAECLNATKDTRKWKTEVTVFER
jgi:hypothetical protein